MKATRNQIMGMIIALIILCSLLLTPSCTAYKHLEDNGNVLWYYTKALKVIDAKDNHYLLESFSNPRRTYQYKSYKPMSIGDTLIMTDSVRTYLTILKQKE